GLKDWVVINMGSITGGDGQKLKEECTRERHYRKLKIYVPDPDNSVQTINIRYTVSDALRFFEDHDEFYWNVTGDEWTVPIQSATAHIVLPEGTANLRANTFTGAYGSRARDASAPLAGTRVHRPTPRPPHLPEGPT